MRLRIQHLVFAVLMGVSLSGSIACSSPTLRDVEVAEDFAFETNQPLEIRISRSNLAEDIGIGSIEGVELARMDGHIIYRGPLPKNRPLVVNLGAPSQDKSVRVKYMSESDQVERLIEIKNNIAEGIIQ